MTDFSIGDGWMPLLVPVVALSKKKGIPLVQVKEKFGGLRIYTDVADEELDAAIRKAEEKASHTCEICGNEEASLRSNKGWLTTRCDVCHPT
jgi:hypothetical protein